MLLLASEQERDSFRGSRSRSRRRRDRLSHSLLRISRSLTHTQQIRRRYTIWPWARRAILDFLLELAQSSSPILYLENIPDVGIHRLPHNHSPPSGDSLGTSLRCRVDISFATSNRRLSDPLDLQEAVRPWSPWRSCSRPDS